VSDEALAALDLFLGWHHHQFPVFHDGARQPSRWHIAGRRMTRLALIPLYLAAIVAANLITTHYAKIGHPEVSIYTAFAPSPSTSSSATPSTTGTTGRKRCCSSAASSSPAPS
jgi:hypothetical protein